MTVRGELRLEDPAEVQATLSITMKIRDWARLREQLTTTSGWPAWEVIEMIEKLVGKAEAAYGTSTTCGSAPS